MIRNASISNCGTYRWTLSRKRDDRPALLVIMFNPSDADHERDDPTVSILCHIASHNGYGGFVVCNICPLRTPLPIGAIRMINTWDEREAWDERDALMANEEILQREARAAKAILFAWGALGYRCEAYVDWVQEQIEEAAGDTPIYCLGRTKLGYPKHPLARGKHKVPQNAPLIAWKQ